MPAILSVENLYKTYESGFQALKGVNLEIDQGEILALLGPNGAGKTTLISTICGITLPTEGAITVAGFDSQREFRAAREVIGLVPQEINLEPFEKVINSVRLSRGLFGKPRNEALIEEILKKLSLWEKRDARINELSGGMKRRVLIAKALSHEPKILFLDEPTAGVDVELRKDMWSIVAALKEQGTTIILTTHYIEEAEAIADRIGVIRRGEILLVEEKQTLMARMGKKELSVQLSEPVQSVPDVLKSYDLAIRDEGNTLVYSYDTAGARTGITSLLSALAEAGLVLKDVQTRQSSLEEIFVGLVHEGESQ